MSIMTKTCFYVLDRFVYTWNVGW